jgi:hypothetical protein
MARDWNARPAPQKTTITEVARRYHAAAVALAQTLGLFLPEVLTQHRESVTAVFIECGRCDLRVPASVRLPPLGAQGDGQAVRHPQAGQANGAGDPAPPRGEQEPLHGDPPIPTTIPADGDLPCAGQEIARRCQINSPETMCRYRGGKSTTPLFLMRRWLCP